MRIFVRRGARRRFDKLTQAAAALPVNIEWDRRRPDAPVDTTSAAAEGTSDPERRQVPPFTWKTADFVLADSAWEEPDAGDAPRKRESRDPKS
jgi:hypothetical protein